MREAKKRKVHAPEFKAKVGLEALRGVKTINEIGQEFGVHPLQVGQWKKEIQEQAKTLRTWIDKSDAVAVVRQCALAGVSRATIYAQQIPRPIDDGELLVSRLIDKEYTRRPFYGSRKIAIFLRQAGHAINRKRVQRLMQMLGLAGMAPGPNTSRAHPEHKIYPYLLRGMPVVRPNQVWSTDLTYIRLRGALCTWWRSSIGTRAGCSAGGSATAWKRRSVSIAWTRHCATMASRKCSTVIRAHGSPARPSSMCSSARVW